jgi:small-conductance mechanosensitive channel/CRP-like cAMP-binding protein
MSQALLPLGLCSLLILASWFMPMGRMRWPLWLRAGCNIALYVALTILLIRTIGSPFRPHYFSAYPGIEFWVKLIEAGWWLLGARGAIGLTRFAVAVEHRPRETQLLSDLAGGVIYIATSLAIINFVFAVPIGGLLATSGIIAIVLGLALQSTLADVFSGIAVGLERPYRVGDLLWVDGGIEGLVTQVTWRSTHIATGQNNIAIVPNSVIAKARLINRSRPTPLRGDTIEVSVDPSISPERCTEALQAATRSCRILLQTPAPSINCIKLAGDGMVFEIGFSVASSGQIGAARTELLQEVQRHLRHSGIPLAVAGLAILPPVQIPTPAQLLAQSDLFGVIEASQRELLARHFSTILLQPGETLISEGGTPDALYVIAAGAAELTVNEAGGPRVAHRMKPGESLGAIGLITGENYFATVRALTPLKAYRLDKEAIAAAIKIQPELAHGLEELAKRGQAALRADAAAHETQKKAHPDMLLSKLRSLVEILKSR